MNIPLLQAANALGIRNIEGITPGTFHCRPHPHMARAWCVAGVDDQGRVLHARGIAGGVPHWWERQEARDAAAKLNGVPA